MFRCLENAIKNNLFETANILLTDSLLVNDKVEPTKILSSIKDAGKQVTKTFDDMLEKIYLERSKPIMMRPPF